MTAKKPTEWALLLEDFTRLRNGFAEGHKAVDKIFKSLSSQDKKKLEKLRGALDGGRLRDPAFRKDKSATYPVTPPEIVIPDDTMRLLMRCVLEISQALAGLHSPDHFQTREEMEKIKSLIEGFRKREPRKSPSGE